MADSAWFYRKNKDGSIEGKIFEDGKMPRGWKDTPAAFSASDAAEETEPTAEDPEAGE